MTCQSRYFLGMSDHRESVIEVVGDRFHRSPLHTCLPQAIACIVVLVASIGQESICPEMLFFMSGHRLISPFPMDPKEAKTSGAPSLIVQHTYVRPFVASKMACHVGGFSDDS